MYENWYVMFQDAPWIGVGMGTLLIIGVWLVAIAVMVVFTPLMLLLTWALAKVGAGVARAYRRSRPAAAA